MAKKQAQNQDNRKQAGSGSYPRKAGLLIYVPALCNVIGTLMLLVVIAAAAPLTIPNFLGYDVYNVVSGSMEPTVPI